MLRLWALLHGWNQKREIQTTICVDIQMLRAQAGSEIQNLYLPGCKGKKGKQHLWGQHIQPEHKVKQRRLLRSGLFWYSLRKGLRLVPDPQQQPGSSLEYSSSTLSVWRPVTCRGPAFNRHTFVIKVYLNIRYWYGGTQYTKSYILIK